MKRLIVLLALSLSSCIAVLAQTRTYVQMSDEMSKSGMEADFEIRFSEAVASYEPSTHWTPVNPVQISNEVWVSGRGMYENETCRNAAFYTKTSDGDYVPVFSAGMPEESVRTICSVDCGLDLIAKLTFNRYGFKADHAECPVGALVDFCLNEGCLPFVQIESRDENQIVAALIMVNKPAGYNHVFKFDVPISVIEAGKGVVEVTLNAYVPTHNVKNLYSDKTDR